MAAASEPGPRRSGTFGGRREGVRVEAPAGAGHQAALSRRARNPALSFLRVTDGDAGAPEEWGARGDIAATRGGEGQNAESEDGGPGPALRM